MTVVAKILHAIRTATFVIALMMAGWVNAIAAHVPVDHYSVEVSSQMSHGHEHGDGQTWSGADPSDDQARAGVDRPDTQASLDGPHSHTDISTAQAGPTIERTSHRVTFAWSGATLVEQSEYPLIRPPRVL